MSELLKINVGGHTEKKNGLTYLSWAWAWTEVLKLDPAATWSVVEYGNERGNALPCMYLNDGTAMVKVEVTLKGHTKACLLPVMSNSNKAIPNPNAMDVNKAIMRCMTKAVSMHGLGLFIYAGEDMPEADPDALLHVITASTTLDALRIAYDAAKAALPDAHHPAINRATGARKKELQPQAEKAPS